MARSIWLIAMFSSYAVMAVACSSPIVEESGGFDAQVDGALGEIQLDLPENIEVSACESARIKVDVQGDVASVHVSVEGRPPLALSYDGSEVSFIAPAEGSDTIFQIRVIASSPNGMKYDGLVDVLVKGAPIQPGLSDGMVLGCAPFRHGVASGDPTAQSVILWTRYTPDEGEGDVTLRWVVSEDSNIEKIVAEGTVNVSAAGDYTAHVPVDGLSPNTTYYYRFSGPGERPSALGRTRTAPSGDAESIRLAAMSCSSIYSGYFNAYRRIGERDDLDVVIHLGDYIYDFVDEDEQVRVPEPYPSEPANLSQWRQRHAYYLSDPDLRLARAMHPWIVIWDNHDVAGAPEGGYDGSIQAFREWVPMAASGSSEDTAYRRLSYGDLLDILVLDVLLHRNTQKVPGSDEFSILGDTQWAWIEETLETSKASWRVIGSQKIMGTVRVDPAFRDGSEFFDTKTWDGFPADRKRFFGMLDSLGIQNNVVVSGDSHISLAQDLVDEPALMDPPYDPTTSDASVGVEILPTSISRGNFNEQVGDLPELFDYLAAETMALNPHHHYLELTKHGYGILDVTKERVVAEIWYSDILFPQDTETLGVALQVEAGTQKWRPLD